ncbi:MAG: rhodanese-like domain-containing protein [Proteobacteria bacterium]|nr:rhodanese-like domain-containing protein [Pseudomonadota bacterium]MDA1332035.1 rhodanese-like domain-containing protein [Pseudomonadota bacterium]
MDFISSNIWLVMAVLISGGYLIIPRLMLGNATPITLEAQELVQLINRKHAAVIDVRDAKDFEAGSILGAKNMPFGSLKQRAHELKKLEKHPIALVCTSGAKSRAAQKLLSKEGFDNLYVLSGGMSAWTQASLPTSREGK